MFDAVSSITSLELTISNQATLLNYSNYIKPYTPAQGVTSGDSQQSVHADAKGCDGVYTCL